MTELMDGLQLFFPILLREELLVEPFVDIFTQLLVGCAW